EVAAFVGPGTRVVDLVGRVVLPGIIDAHIHPAGTAQTLDMCKLGDKPISSKEVRSQVAACLAQRPGDPNHWFEVAAVDPAGLVLTREDLDAMLADRPLILYG